MGWHPVAVIDFISMDSRALQSAEIEAPPAATRSGQELLYHGFLERRIFPLKLQRLWCCCCCLFARLLPRSWQLIRDWTHLFLVLSVLVSTLLACTTVLGITGEARWNSCWAFALPYVLLCSFYFLRTIGQYDHHLFGKEQEVRAQRDALLTSYRFLVTDMEDMLERSKESSAGFAERNLEAKRRDFQRFLQKVRALCVSQEVDDACEAELLLSQFKLFILHWLSVFRECSVDPVGAPKILVTPDELHRGKSILEVIDLVLNRLKFAEVKFISVKRQEHQRLMESSRAAATKRLTEAESPAMDIQTPRRLPLWISFGNKGIGCRCCGRFPWELRFCCVRLVALSREHLLVLVGLLIGLLLLATVCPSSDTALSTIVVVQLMVNVTCLLILLVRFEDIDTIQRLEKETLELEAARENVSQQAEYMRAFWTDMQTLSDLWLHRTVPCLDLLHEMTGHLEDSAKGDMVIFMMEINRHLGSFGDHFGELELWQSQSGLTKEDKEKLGNQIVTLCRESDFGAMLVKLQGTIANGSGNARKGLADGAT